MVRQYLLRVVPWIEILIRQNVRRTPFSIHGTLAEHLKIKISDANSRRLAGRSNLI
jgi:Txe/YoeB family toxin of Txe-Axe toxin-antitoxin module